MEKQHMSTASFHERRLEESELYQRKQWQQRRAQDLARLRALYYLEEKRSDVWPCILDQLLERKGDAV